RTWTPEQAVEHMKDDVSECVATAPKTTDAERKEEKTCTCGAAGSGEGHTDWCDWLDVDCPAVHPASRIGASLQRTGVKVMAERYKLQVGRWGMYVHDTETGQDIDMEQVRDRLNAAAALDRIE